MLSRAPASFLQAQSALPPVLSYGAVGALKRLGIGGGCANYLDERSQNRRSGSVSNHTFPSLDFSSS